jgi:hypothetical protein
MNERPNGKWSIERLGKFCSQSQKRMAIDAWRFGHALNLAKAKQDHGEWQTWKKKFVPFLTHSSEHRYRNLAERITEDSLEGIGLTEAYRLLDLVPAKGKPKDSDALFPQAPVTVAEDGDDWGEDLDDFDDLSMLAPPPSFQELPQATGLMEVKVEPEPPMMPTGSLEVEAPQKDRSPEERYKLHLTHGRQQMDALRTWANWLMEQDESFRFKMWRRHRIGLVGKEIAHTIEGLQWLSENLVRS